MLAGGKHPLLERGAVRQIGIHGARGTGKTCYLAALYGRRSNQALGFSISFTDDNPDVSLDHLDNAWRALQSGSVPPATALVNPFRLSLTATYQGQSWQIRTQDYAGVLVQRTSTGSPDLKQEVQQWLSNCDGVLIFVDLSEQRSQLLERLNEVDMLINRLRKLSPDGQTIPIPVAVVFTKWDRVAGDLQGADWQQQQDKLRHYLAANPDFKQFYDQVQNSGDRVEIFPVSAFGKSYDKNVPPPGGAQPFGIHKPILWLLQECDQAILDAAETIVTPLLNKLWKNYQRAIAIYKSVARQRQIVRGPAAEEIGQRLWQWRKHRAFRFGICTLCVATFALLLSTAGAFIWDTYRYEQVCRNLTDAALSPEDKEASAKSYMDTTNPFAKRLGRRHDVERRLAEAKTKWHNDDYGELLRSRREAKDRDDMLPELADRIRKFLHRWPDSEHRAELTTWLADAEARIHKMNESKAWEGLRQFLSQHPKDSEAEQRIKAIDRFLQDYPKSNYKEDANGLKKEAEIAHKRWQQFQALHSDWARVKAECDNLVNKRDFESAINKCVQFRDGCEKFQREVSSWSNYSEYHEGLRRLIDEVNQTGDRYQWLRVLSYAASKPTDYEQIIQMANRYKASNLFTHKRFDKEAEELIEKAATAWDRLEYEKVIKAVSEAISLPVDTTDMKRKTQAFEAAYEQAGSYLKNHCPNKKHRAAVEKWVSWFESIKKPGIAVTVMIVDAKIS